jgi:hypothetical protein
LLLALLDGLGLMELGGELFACRQAHAFKVESQSWETLSSSLPDEPSLPSQGKMTIMN